MQIGFDAKRLFLNDRGLGNYARNLLNGLVTYYPEHNYHLYTPKVSSQYVDPSLLKEKNVYIHTPKGWLNTLSKSAWRSLRLGSISANENLDIFHGLSQELPRDIRKSKAKSVVTIHDIIFLKHPEFYKPIDRKIYLKKMKFAVHNADHVIAISEQTKNDIVETFNIKEDRVSIIYQSCNQVFYTKRSIKEKEAVKTKWRLPDQFILYVGALNDNKNVLVILKALNRLKNEINIPLVIVGNGDTYKSKLIEFATKNNLSDKLIFASEIASPQPLELSSFYQMASLFIFPSHYEGFGIPILESRFSGTPVIASNSSCLHEAGEANTSYFNPNEPEELAEILKNHFNGSTVLECKPPERFKSELLTQQVTSLYEQL